MKQYEAVRQALYQLNGVATLGQLNHEVFEIKDCNWGTKTPFASIRRIVQKDKEIYKIKPGLYGLEKFRKKNEANGIVAETDKNKDAKEVFQFTHTYYQGLLMTIGNLRQLKTFCPDQDKNRLFIQKKLIDIRTIDSLPLYSYPELVKRSSTVDVIWFNERRMPHSFFEIEHSTDMQNSLLKFFDLQDFSANMYIVADSIRESEFSSRINYAAFQTEEFVRRVKFIPYEQIVKMYEKETEQQFFAVSL